MTSRLTSSGNHSRPPRPRSLWPAPRIRTCGQSPFFSVPRVLFFICQPIRFERNILRVCVESPWVADFPPGLSQRCDRGLILTSRIAATDMRMLWKVWTNLTCVFLLPFHNCRLSVSLQVSLQDTLVPRGHAIFGQHQE